MGSFVAADLSALTASVNSLTDVVWPSHAAGTIALTGHASLNTETATLDAAFTSILNTIDTNLRGLFGKRTAASMTGSESGAISMASNPTANRQVGSVIVLAGYSDVQQVVSLGEPSGTAVTTHACPTITPQVAGSGFVMWYMDRVGTGTTTMTPPAGFTKAGEFGTSGSGGTYQCVSYDLSGTHGLTAFTPANWSGAVASTSALVVIAELAPSTLSVTLGLALETDAARALASSKLSTLAVATETDAAVAVSTSKALALGLATEIDSALAVAVSKAVTVGLATEVDSAPPIVTSKAAVVGLPTEVDAALAISASKAATLGLATEFDAAFALAPAKTVAFGVASETDLALPLVATRAPAVLAVATEADATPALGLTKLVTLGLATETDSARPFSISSIVGTELGVGTEVDSAPALTASKQVVLGVATETDSAVPLAGLKTIELGTAAEVDAAFRLIVGVGAPVIPGHLTASVSQSLAAGATFSVLTASTEPTSRLEASDGV